MTIPENEDSLSILRAALKGDRGDEQQRIAEVVVVWADLLLKKNYDYGSSVWKIPIFAPECEAGMAILVRMSDKVSRLAFLLSRATSPAVDETIEDTIRDLGAYCLLYLARDHPN